MVEDLYFYLCQALLCLLALRVEFKPDTVEQLGVTHAPGTSSSLALLQHRLHLASHPPQLFKLIHPPTSKFALPLFVRLLVLVFAGPVPVVHG